MTDIIIVIGKKTVRKTEIPHLQTFARAIHARSKQLITTRDPAPSVASIIAAAYEAAGGTPQYLTNKNYKTYTRMTPSRVIAFTDTKYQAQLTEADPDWETRNWIVIHNPKATEEAATYLTQLLADLGTPLDASS